MRSCSCRHLCQLLDVFEPFSQRSHPRRRRRSGITAGAVGARCAKGVNAPVWQPTKPSPPPSPITNNTEQECRASLFGFTEIFSPVGHCELKPTESIGELGTHGSLKINRGVWLCFACRHS